MAIAIPLCVYLLSPDESLPTPDLLTTQRIFSITANMFARKCAQVPVSGASSAPKH
jgi:hypothetical protein